MSALHQVKISELVKPRKNVGVQVVIGFGFASDWLGL